MKVNDYPIVKDKEQIDKIPVILKNGSYALTDQKNLGHDPFRYRGSFLEEGLASHLEGIKNGTFDDLYLGDMFQIGNRILQIVDFNYWKINREDVSKFYPHVVAIISNGPEFIGNFKNTGYQESAYRKTSLYQELQELERNLERTNANSTYNARILSRSFQDINILSNNNSSFPMGSSKIECLTINMIMGDNYVISPLIDDRDGWDNRQLSLYKKYKEKTESLIIPFRDSLSGDFFVYQYFENNSEQEDTLEKIKDFGILSGLQVVSIIGIYAV